MKVLRSGSKKGGVEMVIYANTCKLRAWARGCIILIRLEKSVSSGLSGTRTLRDFSSSFFLWHALDLFEFLTDTQCPWQPISIVPDIKDIIF